MGTEEPEAPGRPRAPSLRKLVAHVPLQTKQVGAVLVALATIAAAVAAVLPLVNPPGPTVSRVSLLALDWYERNITLGRYFAEQRQQAEALGLRPAAKSGGGSAAAVATAEVADLIPISVARAPDDRQAAIAAQQTLSLTGQSSSSSSTQTPTSPASSSSTQTATSSTSSSSGPTSSSASSSGQTSSTSPRETSSGQATGASAGGTMDPAARQILTQLRGRVSPAALSSVLKRMIIPQLIQPRPSEELTMRSCFGANVGGCALGELGVQARGEVRDMVNLGRLGPATATAPLPSRLTVGLTAPRITALERVLGDVARFSMDIQGYSSKTLWLAWTMYQKQQGFWHPSPDPSFDYRLEAYLVPSVADDQGTLTFWFPIPRRRGDYRVDYEILSPTNPGVPLATSKTSPFH